MRRKLTRIPRHIPITIPDTSNLQQSSLSHIGNSHLKLLLHVQQLGQTVGVRHLPRVEQADVHGEDEDPADVVPDGGHLEDGIGHQPGDVDNAAENPDDQYAPPLTGYQC